MKKRFRRLFTGMLSAVMTLSAMPLATIHGENEVQRYPYTFFAGSSAEGAITINANNVCINGNIATNGTITSTSANFNVNGTITENAAEPMVQCFAKIDNTYFDPTVVETYFEDYFLEDTNINVNTPIEAEGDIELIGNINISSGLKALNDVNLSGNVENTQNSAICSETGDIIIDTENVNLSGLVYAPNGNVNISAMNLNINGVVIIADTITIDCPSLNANYSAAVGEFIGTSTENEPETELYLITYGEYIHETESIKVYWNTNIPQGTFDIQVSDDGESYTSVGTVTDEESYEYAITEPFSQKYIKVIETIGSGDSFESSPIIVKNSNNGYDIEPLDSDEDGLPDFFELKIGTAIDNADTDNDGLTDYQEFAIVGTDPVIFDSAEEGTSDADYDSDSDGLSNIDEVTRTTDPGDPDTDMDGLSDYDEIFVYNTDPLVADSDNDGIDDGSEIKLGLDPNSAATHGVPDGEYKMDQAIDTDNGILSSINTEESPYSLSIEMNTNGDIEKEISVVNSGYSNVIENNAMIGASLDISMSDTCDPEDIVLKYDIKPEFTVNTLDKYSALPEFQGIKRLNVFKFNEEEGMLLPIETKFSDNGTQLYAEVDELGTYCVMDMEIWLDNLGVDMPENDVDISSLQVSYPSSTQIMADEKKKDVPTDLIFILQTAGDYEKVFDSDKQLIYDFSKYVFENYQDVNVYIITFGVMYLTNINAGVNGKKLSNIDEVNQTLNQLKYENANKAYCDRSPAFQCLALDMHLRENSDKFIYQLANGNSDGKNKNYDHFYAIDGVEDNKYRAYSEIVFSNWRYVEESRHRDVINKLADNNDLFLSISSTTLDVLKEHFQRKKSSPMYEYNIIVPTSWKTITLKDKLTEDGETNSDEDELTDWEEVNIDCLVWNEDGSFELPTFSVADLISYTNRYTTDEYSFLTTNDALVSKTYLPIISDPTNKDTDGDTLWDDEEYDMDTDPLINDTDGDGLWDGIEADEGYDPLDPNPDGDSFIDSDEWILGSDPFTYTSGPKEKSLDILKGFIFGDFIDDGNTDVLVGQMSSQVVPFVSDIRDVFGNGANGHWGYAVLSGVALIPAIGDISKVGSELGQFILKHTDDAPLIIRALIETGAKHPEILKHLPLDAVDNIRKVVKQSRVYTATDFKNLKAILIAGGENVDELEKAAKFNSFRAYKKAMGSPGTNCDWHHLVEQCQAKAKRSGFNKADINTFSNMRKTPKDVHTEISKYYSQKQIGTGNLTFRDWLNGKSFDEQQKIGERIWKEKMEEWKEKMKAAGLDIKDYLT